MGKDPEDFLFYRQSIIANAKALYGPHRTYDVIGSPAIKVALIAYSASSSGSTQGEIVRVADGVVSGVSMKKLHEDMAREVVMKLRKCDLAFFSAGYLCFRRANYREPFAVGSLEAGC